MAGKSNGRKQGPADDQSLPIDQVIGRKIETLRRSLGIASEDLANTVGISAAQLEAFEAGRARAAPEVLANIAKALGVSVASLFLRSDD